MEIIRTQNRGPLYTERRFVLPSGLIIEFGAAPPEWAATDPPDPEVVADGGLRIVHDPDDVLERFISACENSQVIPGPGDCFVSFPVREIVKRSASRVR